MKQISFFIILFAATVANAQNNAIFTGSSGDGWHRAAYSQSANNIFNGGVGDGWNFNAFLQSPNSIFNGGVSDGWSFSQFLQPWNNIFVGGQGDGWDFDNFLQSGNAIFAGGQGDGWASTYRPVGALPVTMVSFTAEKKQNTSLLAWQTSSEINTAAFEVERSSNAIFFTKIGVVTAAGNSTTLKRYTLIDQQPLIGPNYYRLRQVDRNGTFVYTPTRLVVFDAATLQKVKVYPVPATTLVTVELPQQLQNENVVLNLSNALGVMVQQQKLYRNTTNRQVLNLSTLPAGVYTLQVSANGFNATQMIIKQ